MRAWFDELPTAMRVVVAVVAGIGALVALLFVYDWLGTTFFDTGGTVG